MIKHLLDVFFPEVCVACEGILSSDEKVLCAGCLHQLPLTYNWENPKNDVFKKFYGRIPLEHASALLSFQREGIARHLIHHLKYKNNPEIGSLIGQWYAEILVDLHQQTPFDAIIPVPLHKKKLKKRGYNQLDAFGKTLSEYLNIPYNQTLLHRPIYLETQTKKNLLKRTEIKDTVFDVNFTTAHHNQHLLLIDDVITTGNTLERCCKALLKIPGIRISIAVMAITHT